MGVWIETQNIVMLLMQSKVTPCMGVWIETKGDLQAWKPRLVTPCMGVWIETILIYKVWLKIQVTPCMGVWIETQSYLGRWQTYLGHTLYGCVDWNCCNGCSYQLCIVTPCMGVWIETLSSLSNSTSSPVTPCMGVWIETEIKLLIIKPYGSHTLYGCVDWNIKKEDLEKQPGQSHPVWVCGLKHHYLIPNEKTERHTLYGCVDWNTIRESFTWKHGESHPVWVCGLKLPSICWS